MTGSPSDTPQQATVPFRFALPPSLGEAEATNRAARFKGFLERSLARPAEVFVVPSYEALSKGVLDGSIDAVWAPPFVCARLEAMGIRVSVRGVRAGEGAYRAALVCRNDAPVTLETLQGSTVAWVDPDSVGGFLLAAAYLRTRQLEPAKVFFRQRFYGSYHAALSAVLSGQETLTSVYAPATQPEGAVLTGASDIIPGAHEKLQVLALTDASPNDGIVVGLHIAPEVTRTLEAAFLAASSTDEGALLSGIFNVDAFEKAPRLGYRALYRVALASV